MEGGGERICCSCAMWWEKSRSLHIRNIVQPYPFNWKLGAEEKKKKKKTFPLGFCPLFFVLLGSWGCGDFRKELLFMSFLTWFIFGQLFGPWEKPSFCNRFNASFACFFFQKTLRRAPPHTTPHHTTQPKKVPQINMMSATCNVDR